MSNEPNKHGLGRHEHRMVRHPLEQRRIDVVGSTHITPHMQRIVFGGSALRGFLSAAADDHVKLFFPNADGDIVAPAFGPNGPEFPPGAKPSPMRDYTPRHYDAQRNELVIDFVLHGDGPASTWAAQAAVGQQIALGGPRGSFIPADDFDHYVLIGDETALPAIGRRLQEMPADSSVRVLVEIPEAADRQDLHSPAKFEITWLDRHGRDAASSDLLEQALQALPTPPGDTYYWIAAESRRARNMRLRLAEERGVPKDWVRATGYWKADGSDEG